MQAYRDAEYLLQRAIYERFGLSPIDPDCIKTADNQLLRTEQRDLMAPAPAEWKDYRVGALGFTIEPWSPSAARRSFLDRFDELTEQVEEAEKQK
jgi:hypothetical protein